MGLNMKKAEYKVKKVSFPKKKDNYYEIFIGNKKLGRAKDVRTAMDACQDHARFTGVFLNHTVEV